MAYTHNEHAGQRGASFCYCHSLLFLRFALLLSARAIITGCERNL
jgi:hypothetical protein